MQTPCQKCGGTGKIAKASCDKCRGERTVMEEKALDALIERGMADGEELVFERASEQMPVSQSLATAQHNSLLLPVPLCLQHATETCLWLGCFAGHNSW
jgi:hypothetical protein